MNLNPLKLKINLKSVCNIFINQSQNFSNAVEQNVAAETEVSVTKILPAKRGTKTKEFKLSKDMKLYLDAPDKQHILNVFPEKFLRKKLKLPEYFYLVDSKLANVVSKYVTKDLSPETEVIEVNPGLGYLTKELVKTDSVKHIQLYEHNEHFLPGLEKIRAQNSERVSLRKGDFVGMWKIIYQDKIDNGNRLETLLEGIQKREWTDDPNVRVIASVGTINFIKHLLNSITFQNGLFSFGRPEFYLIMPPPLYIHLTCSNEFGYLFYRSTTILFQIFFEHEFIAKLPRQHFLPWQHEYNNSSLKKLARITKIDPEFMYLARVTPRRNLHELCSAENLQALWFFVKQHCISRKNRVIPTLERWVPGCGPRLIVNRSKSVKSKILLESQTEIELPKHSIASQNISANDYYEGINIFTEFGDLSPSNMLTLFNTFISWPEFKQCPFLTSMDNNLLKMETSLEATVNGLAIPEEDDHHPQEESVENFEKVNNSNIVK